MKPLMVIRMGHGGTDWMKGDYVIVQVALMAIQDNIPLRERSRVHSGCCPAVTQDQMDVGVILV